MLSQEEENEQIENIRDLEELWTKFSALRWGLVSAFKEEDETRKQPCGDNRTRPRIKTTIESLFQ